MSYLLKKKKKKSQLLSEKFCEKNIFITFLIVFICVVYFADD